MSAEAMERAYQDYYSRCECDDAAGERAAEAAEEQARVDALYGDLETLPGTVVRGASW